MTQADPPASRRTRVRRMPVRRRLTWVLIGMLVALFLGVGVALLSSVPSTRAAQREYADATPYRCGHGAAPPPGITCWQGVDARLVDLERGHTWTGARRTVATVATGGTVMSIEVEPTAAACVSPSDPVVVRLRDATVTAIFTPHGVLPTTADPGIDPDLLLNAGLTLVAVAVLIPTGLALAVLRRRTRGEAAGVSVLWSAASVRVGMVAFILGQVADVVTSAIGQERGLGEGNPLVDVVIRSAGPAGFLLFRLPAIVLVMLGLTQVPPRVASLTLAGLGVVFLTVGVHNAELAATAGRSLSCPGLGPLP